MSFNLCRVILNNIILHVKFLNDINMFSKFAWHLYVTNFGNYFVRHSTTMFILFMCFHIYEQHNYVLVCHHIITLYEFNNITYCMISRGRFFISQANVIWNVASHHLIPNTISVYKSFTFSCHKLLTDTVYANQCHDVVTFSDSFNTPNVTVTGGTWEARCLW